MSKSNATTPTWTKFVFGGISGVAAIIFVHPFDLVKTRMQLSGEGGSKLIYNSSISAMKYIWKNDGFFALYSGLSGSCLRQILYGTTRMGVYNSLYSVVLDNAHKNGTHVTLLDRMGCGVIAGAVGATIGNPSEVVLVRMTSDARLPIEERRNYSNAFSALIRIYKEEGTRTLFKGLSSTVTRCVVQNSFQLGFYSQIKHLLLTHIFSHDNIIIHGVSSFTAGFVSSIFSLPFDIIKTRLQTMKKKKYKNSFDCAYKLLKKEGVKGFWKGFIPYYLRVGPHTVLAFVFLEQLNAFYARYVLKIEKKNIFD